MINMIKQQYDQMLNCSIIWRQISIKKIIHLDQFYNYSFDVKFWHLHKTYEKQERFVLEFGAQLIQTSVELVSQIV